MKNIIRALLSVSLCALTVHHGFSAGAKTSHRQLQSSPDAQKDDVIPGVVVVKLKRGYSAPEGGLQKSSGVLLEAIRLQGVTSLSRAFKTVRQVGDADIAAGKTDLSQIYFATIDRSSDPRAIAAQLSRLGQVEYAEPKYVNYLCDVPNDSAYPGSQQLYFDRMNAPAGWTIAKGSASVVIATVDGGTNWQHPDLEPNLWLNAAEDENHDGVFEPVLAPMGDLNGIDEDNNGFVDDVIGWNFGNNSDNPRGFITAMADHGTGTASTIGAVTNNVRGMAGASWNCRIMPICAAAPGSTMINWGYEGIQYAYMNGAKVINCSWGRSGQHSQFEQDVIDATTQAGALVVAAAGNANTNTDQTPFYPAAYDNVLSVGATLARSDMKASFSNYGVNVTVFAPGDSIWIALDNGSYGWGYGTSFSAPLVAGLAGLIKSAHPAWSPNQIAKQIRLTADSVDADNPGNTGSMGRGRVNFGRALSESHSGVEIVSSSLHTPSGRTLILEGDTLVLSTVVKNILGASAHNIAFTASSNEPALQLLQASVTIARLDSGQGASLPEFKFRVGSLSSQREVLVKLEWVSNVNERDAQTFRTSVFASTGYWYTQTSLTSHGLFSVKAVNANVVWAGGYTPPPPPQWNLPYAPLVVRTTDGGTTWADVTSNLPGTGQGVSCITAIDADRAWVGEYYGGIFATTNGGSSWSQQAYPGTQSSSMDGIWFFDAENGIALGDKASVQEPGAFVVLRTSNGGINWTHLVNEPVAAYNEYGQFNSFWWTDPNHGWFGTNINKVWRTTDAGNTWSNAFIGVTTSTAVSFKDNNTGLVGGSSGELAGSTDGGATWAVPNSPIASGIHLAYAAGSGSAWRTGDTNPFRTDDDGSSWTPEPTYAFLGVPNDISFVDRRNGWIVTDQGDILHYRAVGITAVLQPLPPALPQGFGLAQNYPNPFNPSTTIRYALPNPSRVILTVFSLLGQHVATLVNGDVQAGSHEVKFDASGLASGVYFYRIQAGSFVQTKKMLAIK